MLVVWSSHLSCRHGSSGLVSGLSVITVLTIIFRYHFLITSEIIKKISLNEHYKHTLEVLQIACNFKIDFI